MSDDKARGVPGPTEAPLGVQSPAAACALAAAAASPDGRLYRWPGGTWRARQYPGWRAVVPPPEADVPWHGGATILRLILDRRLRVVERSGTGQPLVVALVKEQEVRSAAGATGRERGS